ncbi:CBASS cGAMP synthase [Stenotrophomonas forensis]|uniref:Cyclic GMP-AMP synthase n=1 Tax=Stenotrophomonas forensis TaxID=2871169 RepID=A0ABY7Y6G8_9GAMM|nr:CBASS cGAMP synthase [Stenotrophomonas sp. DFS-20110405]WDM65571.1 hypothetical protein K5L94_09960 [Stenotrophomonas sp. DFS-20110405]
MGVAARLFVSNDDAESLNRRVRPTDGQLEFLRDNKDALEQWLLNDLADSGYGVSTFLQGSYRFHTLIKPVMSGAEYDVDVGFYFIDGRAEPDSNELRELLRDSLEQFARICDEVKQLDAPKERCSRVRYERKFHIDVPVYHKASDGGGVRLATLSNGWERSNPAAMLDWFQEALDGSDRQKARIRRLVRYMKAWAALKFAGSDGIPSSLLLTVLVVDAAQHLNGEDDDDALAIVVDSIYERLLVDSTVRNPVGGDSDTNLNRLDESDFDVFMEELARFKDSSSRAVDCEDEAEAAAIWCEPFEHLFPLPEGVDGLALEVAGTGLAIQSPVINITVLDGDSHSVLRNYIGRVPFARVGEKLRFAITNPDVIPNHARVTWVVRNTGAGAHEESDLGHSGVDDGSRVWTRGVAYIGRHFMDCEVRVHGQLRSVTRVAVDVNRAAIPPRHPVSRPSYVKLIGKKGR